MTKHWFEVMHELSLMTYKQREKLFNDFKMQSYNWALDTLDALKAVVVDLEQQTATARRFDMHKQEINRAVKKYKDYLLR
jgi:hypothetical protein